VAWGKQENESSFSTPIRRANITTLEENPECWDLSSPMGGGRGHNHYVVPKENKTQKKSKGRKRGSFPLKTRNPERTFGRN